MSVEDIKTCCNLLNDKLSGIPINEVVERMQQIEPLLASHIARHEVLFEAFVNAFMRFATDHVYCSGQSNMLYQPEFADIEKLKEIQVNNVAVVSSKFKLNEDEEGELMIVGPTRMQYSRVVALMEYMSKVIEDLYRSENR